MSTVSKETKIWPYNCAAASDDVELLCIMNEIDKYIYTGLLAQDRNSIVGQGPVKRRRIKYEIKTFINVKTEFRPFFQIGVQCISVT